MHLNFIITLWLCRALHKYLIQITLQAKAPGKSQKVTHCFLFRDEWLGNSGAADGEGYWCWFNHLRMAPIRACGSHPGSSVWLAVPPHCAQSIWHLPATALQQNAQFSSLQCFTHNALWFLNFFFSTAATEPLCSDIEEDREDVWLLSSVSFSLDKCI